MRRPELALTGRRALRDSRSYALSKREVLVITLVVLVPVPLFAVSGLNFPLPGIVQRVAASLVPGIRGALGVDSEVAPSSMAAIELVVDARRGTHPSPARGSSPRAIAETRAGSERRVGVNVRTGSGARSARSGTSTVAKPTRSASGTESAPVPKQADAVNATPSAAPSGAAPVAKSGEPDVGSSIGASGNVASITPVAPAPDNRDGSGGSGDGRIPSVPPPTDDAGVSVDLPARPGDDVSVRLPAGPAGTSVAVSAGTAGSGGADGGALGAGETDVSAAVTLPGGTTAEATVSLPVGVDLPILGGGGSGAGGSSASGSGTSSGTGGSGSGGSGGSGPAGGLGVSLGIGLGSK
jgi:hypothetical protein